MSESLRNDGRVWVPKKKGDTRSPEQIPEDERDYYLERKYPSFGNLVPRDVASRNAKQACDEGRGVGESGLAVYLDFKDAIARLGPEVIKEKYGNLFQMYNKITDEDPYKVPMRIYPAIHYTMGGLWVDYNLMSTVPGLHVLGEANFSDHGANRLGASALMQGLADGYFVIPYTIGDYLASSTLPKVTTDHDAFKEAAAQRADPDQQAALGERQPRHPRDSPRAGPHHVGRRRHGAHRCEPEARAVRDSRSCARSSGTTSRCRASADNLNQSLEYAGPRRRLSRVRRTAGARRARAARVVRRPLPRREPDARRRSACATTSTTRTSRRGSSRASARAPELHKEPLEFEEVHPTQRSYK